MNGQDRWYRDGSKRGCEQGEDRLAHQVRNQRETDSQRKVNHQRKDDGRRKSDTGRKDDDRYEARGNGKAAHRR